MPCDKCGSRTKYRATEAAAVESGNSQRLMIKRPASEIKFQYVGETGMTVIGPVTFRQYRFGKPGAIVGVDPNDARSLESVPHLRRIK